MKHLRILTAISMFVLFIAASQSTEAQDIRHRNFALDTVFRIGTHLIGLPIIAWDSLRIEFTQTYSGDFFGIRRAIQTPDATWLDTLIRNTYMQADDSTNLRDTVGYNFIFVPSRFGAMYQNARAVDNYPWVDPNVQYYGADIINIDGNSWDSVKSNGLLRSLKIDRDTSASPTVMMGRGRYISMQAFFRSGISGIDIYDTLNINADSAHYMKIVVALKIPATELAEIVSDSAVLVYVDLYRRIRSHQSVSTCICNIYQNFQRLAITKGAYNDAIDNGRVDPITQYPELTFWMNMRDTAGPWFDGSHKYHAQFGGFFGWADTLTARVLRCDSVLDTLVRFEGFDSNKTVEFPNTVNEGDLTYNIVTTRKATVSLMRIRFAMHLLDVLERGDLDDWLRQDFELLFHPTDTIMAKLRRRTMRIGVHDEPFLPVFRETELLSIKAQEFLDEFSPNDKRGLFQNPTSNFEGWRLFMGDLDTTKSRLKPGHLITRQAYSFIPSWMPCYYANPDLMDDKTLSGYFAAKDTFAHRGSDSFFAPKRIAFSTASDYSHYTSEVQNTCLGQVRDGVNPSLVHFYAPLVPHLSQAMRVARGKYSLFGSDSQNVWNVVTVAGWLPEPLPPGSIGHDPNGYKGVWSIFPTSPEMTTAQSWLSLNCGIDGIVWQDPVWDGVNVGIMDSRTGDHSFDYRDSLSPNHPSFAGQAKWTLPKMWYGFASRFRAVKSIGDTFRDVVLPVYNHLQRPGYQISVHDSVQSFSDIPLVDTLISQRALRYDSSSFVYSDTNDIRSQSFIELTVFRPKSYIDTGMWKNSLYMLVTNRRTWPIDFTSYTTRTTAYGSDALGFGNIDVRRPIVRLSNETSVIADSFRIQRIGDTVSHVYAYHTDVVLDWLTPGWGAMYRVTPIPRAVSYYGVAYNNAQRVENPSLDTLARPRITVYERDSIIYMRLVSTNGAWTKEFRVSDSADAAGSSRAYNFNPAVSVVRNGNSAMVVWERRVGSIGIYSYSTVEARLYCARPETDSLPVSVRMTLSTSDSLPNNLLRTPAVVGADSGYAVAWAGPYTGIKIVGIRDTVFTATTASNYISAVSTIRAGNIAVYRLGQAPVILDSLSLFPTLAYVKNKQSVFFGSPQTHDVYLAWQQGGGSSGVGPFIYFTPVGMRFPAGYVPVVIATALREHVTQDLPGCRFIHPCIAADTLRVAVAFEVPDQLTWKRDFLSPAKNIVTLRFRDSVTPSGQILSRWRTPAYSWAHPDLSYIFPSVVQFPFVPTITLRSDIPGGLSWYMPDGSGDSRMMLYRYMERGLDSSLHGVDPIMVRSPFARAGTSYSTSGVFYREPNITGDTAVNPFGISSVYYAARLENTPSLPSALFVNSIPRGGAIFANFVLRQKVYDHESCDIPAIIGGIGVRDKRGLGTEDGSGILFGTKYVNALPLTFFGEPDSGNTIVDTIVNIRNVVRTGVFRSPSGGITIQWGIQGSPTLATWLQMAPSDSILNIPANIVVALQLVRASNNAVLWTSDTVSAASLMGSDPVGFETDIAADSLAGVDSLAYVRMFVYAPLNLDYSVSTGYQFIDDPEFAFPKRVRRSNGDESPGDVSITISVHPNPVNDRTTTVVVQSPFGDEATKLELYDITGALLYDLGPVELKDGYGSGQLDVSRLKSGVYSLVVHQKGKVASTKLTVVR